MELAREARRPRERVGRRHQPVPGVREPAGRRAARLAVRVTLEPVATPPAEEARRAQAERVGLPQARAELVWGAQAPSLSSMEPI